jgi:hypothetical protein
MVAAHSLLLLRHGTERRLGGMNPEGEPPAVPAPDASPA